MKKFLIPVFIFATIYLSNLNDQLTLRNYAFCSTDGTAQFMMMPSKGRTEEVVLRNFKKWQEKDWENRKSQQLHHTVEKNYLQFWKWMEYRSSYYQYPYQACELVQVGS